MEMKKANSNQEYRPKSKNPEEDAKEDHSKASGKESGGKGKQARGGKKPDNNKNAGTPVKLPTVELSSFKTHK